MPLPWKTYLPCRFETTALEEPSAVMESAMFREILGAMSQENVEKVQRAYELWNADDVEAFLDLWHPRGIYTTSGTFPGFQPAYRGREGMARFRDTMLEAWASFQLEPTGLVDRLISAPTRAEALEAAGLSE